MATKSFKPMLSATYDPKVAIKFPVLASPKLDGFRCLIVDGVPMTRSLKHPVPNKEVQRQLAGLPWFDGELLVGEPNAPGVLRKTQSGINSEDGSPDWTYYVFDTCDPTEVEVPFQQRLKRIEDRVIRARAKMAEPHRLVHLPHRYLYDRMELSHYEQEVVAAGYEGVMIRDPLGTYKWGRSTVREAGLIKIKRWEDAEARIVGVFEELENRNEATINALGKTERSSHKDNKIGKGTLGGYHCVTYRGAEDGTWAYEGSDGREEIKFDLGAAANTTREERDRLWGTRDALIGRLVTFKYQVRPGVDSPQHPVFKDFRTPSE